ncbi:hypothetical protein E2C01_100774 [Portunus trituberculatus]|uniref:Uncharacterized protein n=1 Tax=Portunus trituberculatus TaxID=210409 RepID=A0A5B7K8X3_PORTR|nr:hypothetical protein [Portunus trituberculatus]
MMKVTRKQKGHKKKKRPSDHESTASSVAHLISALFFGIPRALETEAGSQPITAKLPSSSLTRQIQTQKIS